MAGKNTIIYKLESEEKTGTFYVFRKKSKDQKKYSFKKYDKKLRKHVRFGEKKLK